MSFDEHLCPPALYTRYCRTNALFFQGDLVLDMEIFI